MAELSTLSPSPPALGDPHTAPSIPPSSSALPAANSPPSESAREKVLPMSSLYNDKALGRRSPAPQPGSPPLTLVSPSSPPKPAAETPGLLLGCDATSTIVASGSDAVTEAHVITQEAVTGHPAGSGPPIIETETPEVSREPPVQSEAQPASPSPEVNSGPNLYPNVHVTHNPNPVMDDCQQTAINTPVATSTSPAPADTAETTTTAAAAAAADGEKPQSPEQAQKPQSQPPPVSPKPNTPVDVRKPDLPSTPSRAEPPSPTIPLIQEPECALPYRNPNPRPAPDTLSYLESASLMSGTLESLSGLGEDGSSVGSDSEINGLAVRRTDKYGFLGGTQYSESG